MRQHVARIFGADKVGSTGLGGAVYVMKDNGVPVQVVKISMVDDGPAAGTVQRGVEIEGSTEVGGQQHAQCLHARFAGIRPFR
eukprot:8932634-Pyramimonas_sp.AAC.1